MKHTTDENLTREWIAGSLMGAIMLACAATAQTDTPDIEARVAETLAKTTERQEQVLRQQLSRPYPSVGVYRTVWQAHARYHLNEDPGKADAELIAQRDIIVANVPNNVQWNIYPLARVYLLYSSRSRFHPGRMSAEAEQAILDIMFAWIEQDPNANRTMADPRMVWEYYATENHHWPFTSGLWSACLIFKDLPAYRDKTLANGTTMAEMAGLMDGYYKLFFREKAMKGLLTEAGSPYTKYQANSLYNIYDFADDKELKKLADQFLNLYYADWAIEQVGGLRGGPRHRSIVGSGSSNTSDPLGHFAFGLGPSTRHPAFSDAATTTWRPDPLVVELALAQGDRGVYEIRSRRPGRAASPADNLRQADPEGGDLLRTTYHTPAFIMGMNMVPAIPADQWVSISSQSRRNYITFYGEGTAAMIYTQRKSPLNKFWKSPLNKFYNEEWGVQDKGVMLLQILPKSHTYNKDPLQMVYFHESLEPVERDGWVFVEAMDAYCAVKVLRGAALLRQAAEDDFRAHRPDPKEWNARILELEDRHSPILFEVNQKSAYESFAAFQNEVMTNRLEVTDNKAVYASRAYDNELTLHTDYSALPEIDGKPVDLAPEYVYRSPYLNADFGKGVVEITRGETRLTLDFGTSPKILATTPAAGTTDNHPAANLTAAFDQPVTMGNGNITLVHSASGSVVETFNAATSPRISVSGSILTIDPTADLAHSTAYHILMDGGTVIENGGRAFEGITSATTWSFTTGIRPFTYTPTDATAENWWGNLTPRRAIDGSGMSPSNPVTPASTADNVADNMWVSNNTPRPWITFDLGSVRKVSGFRLWNYNQLQNNNDLSSRGIRNAEIFIGDSLPPDGTPYAQTGPAWGTRVAGFTSMTQAPATNSAPGVDYFFPASVSTRYVQIRVLDNWGAGGYTGIAEILFHGASANEAPQFTTDPLTTSAASGGQPYAASLAAMATDADGDTLTFAKTAGPAWLEIAPDGALTGTPGPADAGANTFTVSVTDGIAPPVTATLEITVNPSAATPPETTATSP